MTKLNLHTRIEALDPHVMEQARARWDQLTKPLGALGRLEEIGIQLAGIQGTIFPRVDKRAIVVMCGDHGVVAEGVSAYPAEVTGLMMQNFVNKKAAINVLAAQMSADVHVVDIGSRVDAQFPGVLHRNVKKGTANMAQGPAMTREEALQAIQVGIELAEQLKQNDTQVICLGEMGIGNTTPSTALTAVLTGRPLAELVGIGTGIGEAERLHKRAIIARAIEINQPDANDPLDALAKVGGLEIAGLAGVAIGAAANRIAVVVDGVIAAAAALVAVRLEPGAGDFLFPSHLSQEPAHRILLDAVGLAPLFDLQMRLGEGTGAALALPLLDAASGLVAKMATFAELGL